MPAAIRRPPTVRNDRRAARPRRTARTAGGTAPGSGRLPRSAGRARSPPALLVEVDEASRSASGSGESSRTTAPTASASGPCAGSRGAPSCRASRGSHPCPRRPEGHDRADVLAFHVERPAMIDLDGSERVRQDVSGQVDAAEPARSTTSHSPQSGPAKPGRQGLGDRRQVDQVGQDRRVVAVVGRPEEHRFRARGHGRPARGRPRGAWWCRSARLRAPPRGGA